MATITKTFKEDQLNGTKSTWTFQITGADITVNGDTFVWNSPTVQAKYVGSGKGYGRAETDIYDFNIGSISIPAQRGWKYSTGTTWSAKVAMASGTLYTIAKRTSYNGSSYDSHTKTLSTGTYFNTTNKTSRVLYLNSTYGAYLYGFSSNASESEKTTDWGSLDAAIGNIAKITLDVPPTIEFETPVYSTPHYAGLGSYSVQITEAKAYYGGDVSKITLAIGEDSVEQTYSSPIINDQTISIIPTVAGSYKPILTIEDSRGQTYTEELPQILVNAYNNPSVAFDIFRSDANGIKADEGLYGLITATITYTDALVTLNAPTVVVKDENGVLQGSSTTWYSDYNAQSGVQGSAISDWSSLTAIDHKVTIYGLVSITNSFLTEKSYQIDITERDSQDGYSQTVTQILSTAFYTIDFRAGGKEIAFGAPANDDVTNYPDGLFKCKMNFIDMKMIGEIKMYAGLVIPNGWLLCDGSEILINDYPLLYSAIGDTWGVASDSDHFILPNFVGRMPLGASDINTTEWITITGENEYSSFILDSPTYARWGTGTTWYYKMLDAGEYFPTYANMNTLFGGDPASGVAKCVQVALNVASNGGYSWWRPSVNDMPTHLHSQPSHSHFSGLYTVPDRFGAGSRDAAGAYTGYSGQVAINTGGASPNTNNTGGGRYISQMPPFAVINYIICAA